MQYAFVHRPPWIGCRARHYSDRFATSGWSFLCLSVYYGKFGLCQEPAHNQIEPSCPWYKLEVQSVTQPPQHTNHYSFPTSIQSLSIDVSFPLSNLVTLSHFQQKLVSYFPDSRPELPNLEGLNLQVAFSFDRQVEIPTFMIYRN